MTADNPVLPRACPECGQPLRFEKGYPDSRLEPGFPDGVYCAECGHDEQPTTEDYELLDSLALRDPGALARLERRGSEALPPSMPRPPLGEKAHAMIREAGELDSRIEAYLKKKGMNL